MYPIPSRSNDIYNMVLESLNKEWEIRVFKENEWYKADERIDNNELSKIIANKIFNQKDLKKDYKIIEGILIEIREELNKLGSRIFRRDWISKSSFDDFCNNKLNEIINFKSPELQMINQIKEAYYERKTNYNFRFNNERNGILLSLNPQPVRNIKVEYLQFDKTNNSDELSKGRSLTLYMGLDEIISNMQTIINSTRNNLIKSKKEIWNYFTNYFSFHKYLKICFISVILTS